jgi:hypothetical protein
VYEIQKHEIENILDHTGKPRNSYQIDVLRARVIHLPIVIDDIFIDEDISISISR